MFAHLLRCHAQSPADPAASHTIFKLLHWNLADARVTLRPREVASTHAAHTWSRSGLTEVIVTMGDSGMVRGPLHEHRKGRGRTVCETPAQPYEHRAFHLRI